MAELSTKHGIFETGVKDEHGVAYKDSRVVGSYDKHLTEYTVKDGTEVICDRAFYDKKDLRELHLPSSVKAIGESAFAGCKALERVNIPEGVTEIKTATFRDCKSLRRLELPASCIKIAKWAFTGGIETLVCNAPAMQIDKSAFLSCKTLKTVIVPEGCTNAYTQAFVPCGFMPLFEEMKEEQIAEEPLYIDDHDEEILDDDIFEDDDENIFEDEEKDNDDDNDLSTNKKEQIMEFTFVRKFEVWDGNESSYYAYPGLIKGDTCYDMEENVNEVKTWADLEYYSDPANYNENQEYEIPTSAKDYDSIADWLLDDWSDMIIDDGYEVSDYEFVIDFWKDGEIIFSKKLYKR